ncbi:AAA domain-containing protein [Adhaeribacter terreus]|uniref:AAA domain-containing protein n=1 Tax=Adhaeribacter terreus TaxID=529703 RepID=A0ABW0EB28_9BACT
MEQILKSYQRRLINLSGNNRSLVLRRLSAGLHLDLQSFDFVNSQPAFELLREIIAGKKHVTLAPFADPRQADVAPLSSKLKEILRRIALLKEERGTEELFVGWPFVTGKLNDGTLLRAPLLFFPVKLELNAKQQWILSREKTSEPIFNQNFLLAYAHYNQLHADENLLDFDFSDFPKDALEFRTKLYEVLKNSSLQLNFNQQLFEDKLLPFRSLTKAEMEAQYKPGELKLFPEAVLGIFPQAGSYLMADYDELLQKPELNSFEALFKTEVETKNLTGNLEQNTFAVFDLDAPQELVLQEVKRGRSLVVQGPPGTGKSQLICNLVTDFVARGKTVWVVCQKRAALDVVYSRLVSKGFGNFAALVHDFEADRRKVFAQLKLQIEEVETYKKQNNQLPIVFAERKFLETSRRINQILQTLTEFKTALFDASVCGWPAKELYLKSSLKNAALNLPEFRVFTAETLPFFLPQLEQYLTATQDLDAPDFALTERKSFANWNWPERKKLEQFATEIPEKFAAFFKELPEVMQQKGSAVETWKLLQNEAANLEALCELLQADLTVLSLFPVLFQQPAAQLEQVGKTLKKLEKSFAEEPVFLNENELQNALNELAVYEQSRASFWLKTKWQLGSKTNFLGLLEQFYLSFSEVGISALKKRLEKLQERQKLQHYLGQIMGDSVIFSSEITERESQLSTWQKALGAAQLARKLQCKKLLSSDAKTVLFQVKKLLKALQTVENSAANWGGFLTENQIEKLAESTNFQQVFLESLAQYFEAIAAHDTHFGNFSTTEKTVAKTLQKLPGTVAEKLETFQNSVFLNWILELENKYPVLKIAGEEIANLESELQELLLQKQQLSHEIVLTGLRERTYRNLEKNRLGNVTSYRKLYAQVSKKRNLFSLRKLQATFSNEINDLVPCWLASPETISAVFPLSQQPDLVIFDEASQAFSETGLPAIFRAKQVVIAGDENQLAPTDLYRTRWQEEDDETEELFVESLLQLSSLHLPQHWLTQHYRSRFPELIHFSNQHFYRNKLQLIPDKQDIEKGIPAIEFLKVNGLWEKQTNRPEAEKVVELLFKLLAAGQEDIGIITFNFAQQSLLQDLVEFTAAERKIALPETLQIKNIENMQGDEKQVIILAVGYAADASGKVVSQFGSLSQAKGENRLNVAITRAISKLYVVSSLFAQDLKVENAKHEGPKLLQAFLHFAQAVSEGKFSWKPLETESVKHEFFLKDKLLNEAKTVGELSKKLPFADLVLSKDEKFCQLFRTDDDLYFGQVSTRQTHFDVPFRLQKRNWPYRTFYSRQYWQNPEKMVQEIEKTTC